MANFPLRSSIRTGGDEHHRYRDMAFERNAHTSYWTDTEQTYLPSTPPKQSPFSVLPNRSRSYPQPATSFSQDLVRFSASEDIQYRQGDPYATPLRDIQQGIAALQEDIRQLKVDMKSSAPRAKHYSDLSDDSDSDDDDLSDDDGLSDDGAATCTTLVRTSQGTGTASGSNVQQRCEGLRPSEATPWTWSDMYQEYCYTYTLEDGRSQFHWNNAPKEEKPTAPPVPRVALALIPQIPSAQPITRALPEIEEAKATENSQKMVRFSRPQDQQDQQAVPYMAPPDAQQRLTPRIQHQNPRFPSSASAGRPRRVYIETSGQGRHDTLIKIDEDETAIEVRHGHRQMIREPPRCAGRRYDGRCDRGWNC